jgi:hypothetical protein
MSLGTYSELILKMLEPAVEYEQILIKTEMFQDDYDRLQLVCKYMEDIIKEVKELPDNRVKGVASFNER